MVERASGCLRSRGGAVLNPSWQNWPHPPFANYFNPLKHPFPIIYQPPRPRKFKNLSLNQPTPETKSKNIRTTYMRHKANPKQGHYYERNQGPVAKYVCWPENFHSWGFYNRGPITRPLILTLCEHQAKITLGSIASALSFVLYRTITYGKLETRF